MVEILLIHDFIMSEEKLFYKSLFYWEVTFLKSSNINGIIAFVGGDAIIGPLYPTISEK